VSYPSDEIAREGVTVLDLVEDQLVKQLASSGSPAS
jgi:hypothetical protein